MSDIDRENQASSPVQITGGDELFKADVIEDLDGFKKVFTKTSLTDGDISISGGLRIVESQVQVNCTGAANEILLYEKLVANVCTGAMIKFNGSGCFVRLEIDGITIFDVD